MRLFHRRRQLCLMIWVSKIFYKYEGGVIIMHKKILIILAALLLPAVIFAAEEKGTHLDKTKVKFGGCSSCHDVSGKSKTGLLKGRVVDLCLRCHGPSGRPEERAKTNIFTLLMKRSNHPIIDTAKYHIRNEELPEKDPAMPRHVSCEDCHHAHMTSSRNRLAWIRGTSLSGAKKRAEKEAEVCYNCHSDSINLPSSTSNMRFQFDPANASYHPVERVAKGRSRSLYRELPQGSFITCTQCHEPHGSDYPPLLRVNYNTADGAESLYAYELCYTCHNRDSILSNESFRGSQSGDYGHKEHIVYQKTSCFTCHASHGSSANPHLI
ncbi:MAG: hypothetical protein EPN94_06355, partial [Nitrospirae bacterium]